MLSRYVARAYWRRDDQREEFMRILLLAGVALLAACGGNDSDAVDANAVATDNLALDANTSLDATGDLGTNGTIDANTANLMVEDATTNDADTNLANGL
jgi:hypothetical protein